MPMITLLSDFGHRDPYLIQLKMELWNHSPKSQVVDISHDVEKYNLPQAAFIFKSVFDSFPSNTIHIIAVRSIQNSTSKFLLAKLNNQFILTEDNGILSLISNKPPEAIFELNIDQATSFIAKTLFAPIASGLSNGMTPENYGTKTTIFEQRHIPDIKINENEITGQVLYVDSYGNLITDITKELFDKIGKTRAFEISIRREKLNVINTTFQGEQAGNCVAFFNDQNVIEIAILEGDASRLLGMNFLSRISIKFNSNQDATELSRLGF